MNQTLLEIYKKMSKKQLIKELMTDDTHISYRQGICYFCGCKIGTKHYKSFYKKGWYSVWKNGINFFIDGTLAVRCNDCDKKYPNCMSIKGDKK